MAKKRKAKSQQPTQKAFNEHLENYYNKQMHKQLQALLVAAGGGGCRGEGWGSEARWPEVRRVRASRIVPLGPEQRSLGITKL